MTCPSLKNRIMRVCVEYIALFILHVCGKSFHCLVYSPPLCRWWHRFFYVSLENNTEYILYVSTYGKYIPFKWKQS